MNTNNLEVLREPERKRKTGVPRVTWWRLERDGKAPKRISLGENSVGWIRHEIDAWIAERIARRDAGERGRVTT